MKITLLLQINHISSYRLNFCSYSLVTTYGTPNGISHLKYFPLSHYYFPKYMCSAQYGCCTFSSTPCFPGMLLRHFVNILGMVPVNPNIFIFKFHVSCNPNVRSSHLKKISTSFLKIYLLKYPCLWTNKRLTFSLHRSWYPV